MAIQYKWVDVPHTDPDAGAAALNAAGAEGWFFGWVDSNVSAHERVWLTREAPPEPEVPVEPVEPEEPPVEPPPEAEAAEASEDDEPETPTRRGRHR